MPRNTLIPSALALLALLPATFAQADYQLQVPLGTVAAAAPTAPTGALSVAMPVLDGYDQDFLPVITGGVPPYTASIEVVSFEETMMNPGPILPCTRTAPQTYPDIQALGYFNTSEPITTYAQSQSVGVLGTCNFTGEEANPPRYAVSVDPQTGSVLVLVIDGSGWTLNMVYRVTDSTGATAETPPTPVPTVGH